jgi:hypothetical protein
VDSQNAASPKRQATIVAIKYTPQLIDHLTGSLSHRMLSAITTSIEAKVIVTTNAQVP